LSEIRVSLLEVKKVPAFTGYTLKTVHFGSDKLENLGITDS
jgi:hypothetical protein